MVVSDPYKTLALRFFGDSKSQEELQDMIETALNEGEYQDAYDFLKIQSIFEDGVTSPQPTPEQIKAHAENSIKLAENYFKKEKKEVPSSVTEAKSSYNQGLKLNDPKYFWSAGKEALSAYKNLRVAKKFTK